MRMNLQGLPKFIKPFEFMGVHLDNHDDQFVGDCPFPDCGKAQHFYVDPNTGLWDCKVCGVSGNVMSFYRQVFAESLSQYKHDEEFKGLTPTTLERFKVCRSFLTNEWIVPYFSMKDEELLTFGILIEEFGNELKYPPQCDHQLFNLQTVGKSKEKPLLLCEGPTDAMALDAHLRRKGERNDYDIAAVPSANTFKDQWCQFFHGRDLRLLFDNDDAGRKGVLRLTEIFRTSAAHPKFLAVLEWPKGVRERFDIRDLVQQGDPLEAQSGSDDVEEVVEDLSAEVIEDLTDDIEDLSDSDAIEMDLTIE